MVLGGSKRAKRGSKLYERRIHCYSFADFTVATLDDVGIVLCPSNILVSRCTEATCNGPRDRPSLHAHDKIQAALWRIKVMGCAPELTLTKRHHRLRPVQMDMPRNPKWKWWCHSKHLHRYLTRQEMARGMRHRNMHGLGFRGDTLFCEAVECGDLGREGEKAAP